MQCCEWFTGGRKADSGEDGVGGGEMGVNISCIGFHSWNYGSVLEVEGGDDGQSIVLKWLGWQIVWCTNPHKPTQESTWQ